MAQSYVVIGSEESPYSVKVRAYFRYKGLDHDWRDRASAADLFEKHARLPLVPLVVTPEDTGLQDSTPIIETLEEKYPEPGIHPPGAGRFVSQLIEEFADEWGNKWMFHMRWARDIDQTTVSRRFAEGGMPDASESELEARAQAIRERMVPRVWFVGSNETTAPQIEKSYADTLAIVDAHLASRRFLFGDRPAFADFALWGQVYECSRDPTAGEMTRAAPNVVAWIERLLEPTGEFGPFEAWSDLAPTLKPLLEDQIAGLFLPWSAANSKAIESGAAEFDATLKGQRWTQRPQKYHARSLAALKRKYEAAKGDPELDGVLEETGCRTYL